MGIKFDEWARCRCGRIVGCYKDGRFYSGAHPSYIVDNERYCLVCADDIRNAKELGCRPAAPSGTMERKVEEAAHVQDWRELPRAHYDQKTFLSDIPIATSRATSVLLGHALATADIDRWLDTLNNPDAPEVEKDRARHLLKQSAEEFKWLCEQRERIRGMIEVLERQRQEA